MAAPWPEQQHLENHWQWRPEWQQERVCLYWYLTFSGGLESLVDPAGREAMQRADWLDTVPTEWLHVTLCDVGFADELAPQAIEDVVEAARPRVATGEWLRMSFGHASGMEDCIALPVEPAEPVRQLQRELLATTERALGPDHRLAHRHLDWPHLSLGYANRWTPGDAVDEVLTQIGPVPGEVLVDRLVLAAVNRDRRRYEWTVLEELPLSKAIRNPRFPALESADWG